ncbi:hypothetical protein [Rhodocytophaga aerolata]
MFKFLTSSQYPLLICPAVNNVFPGEAFLSKFFLLISAKQRKQTKE